MTRNSITRCRLTIDVVAPAERLQRARLAAAGRADHTNDAGCRLSGRVDLFGRGEDCPGCLEEGQARRVRQDAEHDRRKRLTAAIVAALTPTERRDLATGYLNLAPDLQVVAGAVYADCGGESAAGE